MSIKDNCANTQGFCNHHINTYLQTHQSFHFTLTQSMEAVEVRQKGRDINFDAPP